MCVVRVGVFFERTLPAAADEANVHDTAIPKTRSRQKETVTVGGGKETAVNAVLRGQRHIAVVIQLFWFSICGHTPAIAPVGRGGIVLGQKDSERVDEAIIAEVCIVAILCNLGRTTISVLVCTPVEGCFLLSLAPCKVETIIGSTDCTNIASGPQGTHGMPSSTHSWPSSSPFKAFHWAYKERFSVKINSCLSS